MKEKKVREGKADNPPEFFLVWIAWNERLLTLEMTIYKILITILIFNYTRMIFQSPTIIFVFTREEELRGKISITNFNKNT